MWLITYDIINDKRRTQVAKTLERWGMRVQGSVFECHLNPPEQRTLRGELVALIDPQADSIRWYFVCVPCQRRGQFQGHFADQRPDEGFYLVE